MRTTLLRKMRLLVCLVPLLVSACSDSPEEATDAGKDALAAEDSILRYVPADTPYVFAATEPVPEDVKDKLAPHVESLVASYRSLLQAVINQKPAEASEAQFQMSGETRQRVSSMIDELASMITPDGIPEAGIDRDSTAAFYGVGLLPVLRVTLSDSALFEQAFAKMESGADKKMSVATVDGHSYRYAGDDKGRFVIAVIDDELVMSVVPAGLREDLLKSVLGLSLPETNIAESGALNALAEKYGYQAYGLGFIDVERVLSTFLDDQSGVNGELLALMDYDTSNLTDVCRTEIRAMAGIVPRVVTGYTDITTEHFKSNSVFEMRGDIATGLQTLTAPVPGLGTEQGGLVAFGMSLNMLAAREFYSARLDALEADPYECELFADLQAGVAKGREMLNQPVPPIVYGFRGFLAVIDDIKGMDIQKKQPPTDIDMRFLVATDNAEGLLEMGAMFSPEIAALNLQPDAKPVKLEVPAIASTIDAAYVAMSENALALSFGAGSEAGLEGMLSADSAVPAPFMSMNMDAARYYGFVGDATMLSEGEAQSPEITKATGEIMQSLEEMFSRMSVDVHFTERGVEIPSTVELAE